MQQFMECRTISSRISVVIRNEASCNLPAQCAFIFSIISESIMQYNGKDLAYYIYFGAIVVRSDLKHDMKYH